MSSSGGPTSSNILLLDIEHGIVQGAAHQELEGQI